MRTKAESPTQKDKRCHYPWHVSSVIYLGLVVHVAVSLLFISSPFSLSDAALTTFTQTDTDAGDGWYDAVDSPSEEFRLQCVQESRAAPVLLTKASSFPPAWQRQDQTRALLITRATPTTFFLPRKLPSRPPADDPFLA